MLSPGSRLGGYEIVGSIGAGGMGEVYRARDIKLGRIVALKLIPDLFASDPERLARFEREATTLASLNHPHVAQLYGVEESGEPGSEQAHIRALVMEFVEGEDLAQRIGRGAIPLHDALAIANQITEALEAAHQHGIIHRDLKPANIKVRDDGTVKVLDFGLAKAIVPAETAVLEQPGSSPASSPTITTPAMTIRGVILGTAAYMAPEQAKGRAVDKRADIWAFGCVLYEMLAGKRAFASDDVAETLAAVITKQPDWSALPSALPSNVRRLLQRCLSKDLKWRLHDIADARIELHDMLDPSHLETLPLPLRPRWQRIATVAVIVLTALAAGWSLRAWVASGVSGAPIAEARLEIATPPTTDPLSLAISPDGQTVVFVANNEGRSVLWLRRLDSTTARPLSGTDDASFPFWAPDSRAIAFFTDRQLKRIDLDAGTVQSVAPAQGGRGGTWGRDGTIVFQPSPGRLPLTRVPASGGTPVPLADLKGRFPQFLPDGQHFIYYAAYGGAESATRGVYVARADGSGARHLFDADSAPVYAASGHLLFVRGGTLTAQGFDPSTFELKGEPFPIASNVNVNGPMLHAPIASSATGPILYRTGSSGGLRQFVWVDRAGREIQKLGEPASNLLSPAMSPDGRYLALHRTVDGNGDIWLLETARGILQRITSTPASQFHPTWSPDGTRLVFGSGTDLVAMSIGASQEERLVDTPAVESPNDWSSDGRFLIYATSEPNPSTDLWVLPLFGDRKSLAVAQTAFNEGQAQFSQRADWIAYTSDESGRPEIYAVPFPGPGERVRISTSGGGMARWRADGSELFYIDLDSRLMVVPIRRTRGGGLDIGSPMPLFMTRIGGVVQANSRQQYMVSADGQRFLLNTLAEENASPITVMLNWRGQR